MSTSSAKSKSAKLARKRGVRWESTIRDECSDMKHAEPSMAVVRKNWEAPRANQHTHAKRQTSKPDFGGFICQTGRHVCFEAKATDITTRFDFARIADHQLAHLEQAAGAGAVAFVYVLDGLQRRWVLPVPLIRDCEFAGQSSFSFDDDQRFQKQPGETWLDCWHRLESQGLTR